MKKNCLKVFILMFVLTLIIPLSACFELKYYVKVEINNANAGTVTGAGSYMEGEIVTLTTATEEPDNYTFIGWFKNSELVSTETVYTYTMTPSADIFVAKWQGKQSVVSYHYNYGDDNTINRNIQYGDIVRVIPDGNTGYTFKGWYTDSQCTSERIGDENGNISKYPFTENTSLYAKWEVNSYTLKLTSNILATFTGNESELHEYNSHISITVIPDDNTLDFLGWYNKTELLTDELTYEFNMPAEDITLSAKFKKEDIYEFANNSDGTLTITKYKGAETEIYIPAEYYGRKVTAIKNGAFDGISADKVIIPYSIKTIETGTFVNSDYKIYYETGTSLNTITTGIYGRNHDIYVNCTITDSLPAMVKGYYCNYGGEFSDTTINNKQELVNFIKYLMLYNVTQEIEFKFASDFDYEGMTFDDYIRNFNNNELNNYILEDDYNNNINLQFSYSYHSLTKTMHYVFTKKTKSFATSSTQNVYQTEITPVTVNYVEDYNSEYNYYIDNCNNIAVYNSEQLLYAVEHGFKPVFPQEGTNLEEIYNTAKTILATIIKPGMSDFKKVTAVYDYMALHTIYDTELLTLVENNPNADLTYYRGFYLEGALLDGVCVCDGTTKAISLLLNMEGIKTIRISGYAKSGSGHAWNKVKINNEWYTLDCTSGNAILNGTQEILKHNYLLISDEQMSNSHNENEGYPLSEQMYDYYRNTFIDENVDLYASNIFEVAQFRTYLENYVDEYGEEGKTYSIEFLSTVETSLFGTGHYSISRTTNTLGDYTVYCLIITK